MHLSAILDGSARLEVHLLRHPAQNENVARRHDMVSRQVEARGVRSCRVLQAMRSVPRDAFVPDDLYELAYDDTPLPIGEGQTISQPYIVAVMIDALELRRDERVLEVGAGSGYAAAVLGRIAKSVDAIERLEPLAKRAASTLARLRYDNVAVHHADGTRGWPAHAPYDAIVVAAAGRTIPEPLKQQLAVGGRLVIPVGDNYLLQELLRLTRVSEERFEVETLAAVRFVPLVSEDSSASRPAPQQFG
jgi:protein-L-isoaspartate(D-aspartate) O-methyltransferase